MIGVASGTVARKWSDISHEVDELASTALWTPDTPDFLEKRYERQVSRENPPVSYTQAKVALSRESKTRRASVSCERAARGSATIIEFERLDRAPVQKPTYVGYRGGRGSSRAGVYSSSPSARPATHLPANDYRVERRSDNRRDDSRRASSHLANSRQPGSRRNVARREDRFRPYDDPYDARSPYGEPYEDEFAERPEDLSLRGRLDRVRHEARHRKADRVFDREFADAPAMEEAGPRAALYEGRMGRTHQKSARMQAQAAGRSFDLPGWLRLPTLDGLVVKPHFAAVSLALVCLVMSVGMIFPAAKDYYVGIREKDQAAAEYQAVLERNEELEQHVASLQTDEGMEELAHESLGWVKEGEHSVSVVGEGSSEIGTDSQGQMGSIPAGSVPAPETWYSPVLDFVFGYDG